MSLYEGGKAIRQAERAGIYIGAMTVMARLHRRRVLSAAITPDECWPGHVRFAGQLASSWEQKQARLGSPRERQSVEQAVLILLAGPTAVDLVGEEEASLFPSDPMVDKARKLLRRATWWKAEAEAHMQWLRHRTVVLLASTRTWRFVAGLAQALMANGNLSERQLRNVITASASRKRIGGVEQFVLIDPEKSVLEEPFRPKRRPARPVAGEVKSPERSHVQPATGPSDAIVSAQSVQTVLREFESREGAQAVVRRMTQVEPELVRVIESEAQRTASGVQSAGTGANLAAAAGVLRCGTLVAELLRRGHAELWGDCGGLLEKPK